MQYMELKSFRPLGYISGSFSSTVVKVVYYIPLLPCKLTGSSELRGKYR
jgi:hypothetical protein